MKTVQKKTTGYKEENMKEDILHPLSTPLKDIAKGLGAEISENDNTTCELLSKISKSVNQEVVKLQCNRLGKDYGEWNEDEERYILHLTENGKYLIEGVDDITTLDGMKKAELRIDFGYMKVNPRIGKALNVYGNDLSINGLTGMGWESSYVIFYYASENGSSIYVEVYDNVAYAYSYMEV